VQLLGSMAVLLAVLGAGFVLGKLIKLPDKAKKALGIAQNICIWVLIFAMGVRLGADAKVLAELPVLGSRAAVITLFATGGSVLAVYALCAALQKRGKRP